MGLAGGTRRLQGLLARVLGGWQCCHDAALDPTSSVSLNLGPSTGNGTTPAHPPVITFPSSGSSGFPCRVIPCVPRFAALCLVHSASTAHRLQPTVCLSSSLHNRSVSRLGCGLRRSWTSPWTSLLGPRTLNLEPWTLAADSLATRPPSSARGPGHPFGCAAPHKPNARTETSRNRETTHCLIAQAGRYRYGSR